MASPVGHSLISLGIYYLIAGKIKAVFSEWKILLFVLIIGSLPDVDFIPGILMGNMNIYHETYSHTLGFALIISLLVWILCLVFKRDNGSMLAMLSFILIFIHIFTDTFNVDSRNPVGVMLFWPIDRRYFYMPMQIFPPIDRHNLWNLFSKGNFYALFVEIRVGSAILLLGLLSSLLNKIWRTILDITLFILLVYLLTRLVSN